MQFLLEQGIAGLAGAGAGVAVMGIANHFTRSRALWPVPACPRCGARDRKDWLPFLQPIRTRGVCGACGERQAWPVTAFVELLCIVLAIVLFRQYGWQWLLLSASVEVTVLMAIAVIDFQHRLIPTFLVYPTIVFGLAFSPLWPNLGIGSSLLGGCLAFAIFFGLAFIARVAFGEGALGDGDVSLAALIGVICGYPMVVLSLAVGALCGGIGALLMLLVRRAPLGTTIPYGPYLVMGIIYVLLHGNTTNPLYPN